MKKRKIFFVTGIVLIVFIAIIAGSVLKTTGGNDENKSGSHDVSISGNNEIEFPVKAAVVRKGNLIVWINTSGYAYPVREYEIEPKISGLVTELNSFNGKLVKKGDLLFKLNNAQYKLDVSQAKSELIKSQIEYELQKANSEVGSGGLSKYRLQLDSIKVIYERAKESYNKNKISYEDYSRIERDYETLKTIATLNREDVVASRSGLTNAATNYKKAELNMSHTKYEAPISGLVADCNISKGSYLNIGESSLKVIDISSIKIRCEVTESDLVKITTDEPVEAEFVALPGKKFKGKVIEVNPSVDLTKRTALITVLLNNPGLHNKARDVCFG